MLRLKQRTGREGDKAIAPSVIALVLPALPALHAECGGGENLACWLYNQDYELTVGVLMKHPNLRSDAQVLCDDGNLAACAAAAQSVDNPSGVGGDPVTAVSGLMNACNQGLMDACSRAADIRIGSGLQIESLDRDTAGELIERACKMGFVHACSVRIGLLGAIGRDDYNNYDRSSHFPVLARACEVGIRCETLLERMKPEQPFGCSLCDIDNDEYGRRLDGSYDERCTDCEVTACRDKHCRPDNYDPRWACCSEESDNTPRHPTRAGKRSRADASRLLRAAKEATKPARQLFERGCALGHKDMCLSSALDGDLQELARWLDEISTRR